MRGLTEEKVQQIAEILDGLTWEEWCYIKKSVDDTFGQSMLPPREKIHNALLKGPIRERAESWQGELDSRFIEKK